MSVVTANSVVVVVANGTTESSTTPVRSTSTHLVYVTASPETSSTGVSALGASTGAASRLEAGVLVAIAAFIVSVLML
jgi:hypothetical protein